MQMLVKGVNVNYTFYDNSSNVNLVYLHGWGQNIEMMMPIAKPFIKKYNVLIIDTIHSLEIFKLEVILSLKNQTSIYDGKIY